MVRTLQASKLNGWIAVAILSLPLVACETATEKAHFVTSKPLNAGKDQSTIDATFSAALTPLEDLGLRKREIPDLLAQLSENPYFPPPKPIKCEGVKKELADIDALLGVDIDVPKVALTANQKYAAAGIDFVEDSMVGFVRSQVNIIPLRSIVRRITGANSHEKDVAKAIEGGKLRRAYLKGLSEAKFGDSCLPTPRVITAEKDRDEELEVAKK